MENITDYLKEERSQEWRDEIRKSMKTKERTTRERVSMPEEDPNIRNKSNLEVNRGLETDVAVLEAQRCIDCANPTCMEGCPVGIYIPKFIKKIEVRDFLGAASVLKETNGLPAVCGRGSP